MGSLDEGEVGVCLVPSGHGILDVKVTYLYVLVDLERSKNLFEVGPFCVEGIM